MWKKQKQSSGSFFFKVDWPLRLHFTYGWDLIKEVIFISNKRMCHPIKVSFFNLQKCPSSCLVFLKIISWWWYLVVAIVVTRSFLIVYWILIFNSKFRLDIPNECIRVGSWGFSNPLILHCIANIFHVFELSIWTCGRFTLPEYQVTQQAKDESSKLLVSSSSKRELSAWT